MLTQQDKEFLRNKEICYHYDHTNLTIGEVAQMYGLTPSEVKRILMDDAYGGKK